MNKRSGVHMPDTLTTELGWYLTIYNTDTNRYKQLNKTFKSWSYVFKKNMTLWSGILES